MLAEYIALSRLDGQIVGCRFYYGRDNDLHYVSSGHNVRRKAEYAKRRRGQIKRNEELDRNACGLARTQYLKTKGWLR